MTIDLFPRETAEKMATLAPVQVPEASAWDGFARGTGMYTMQGFAKTGRAIDLMGSIGPIVQDAFTGGTTAQDKYFREHDEVWGRAVDYWTPAPGEVGVAGQVVGQLMSVLPQIIASPSLAVASMQLSTGEDLVRQGVDSTRAQLAGAAMGLGLGVGIWMPVLGQNLWQRVVIGGVAFNVAQGAATRGATGLMLEGTPAAEQFKAFDPTELTIDVLLGAAFGAMVHLSPAARQQGTEAWESIRSWAKTLTPSDKAALATLRQAQHMNVDSTPGRPVDVADVEKHVVRLKTAIEQLERGEPINVENLPAPRTEPVPEQDFDNAARLTEMVEEAEIVRTQEGITEPALPGYMRTTPEMQRTYEDLQSLPKEEQAAGVGDVVEAQLRRAGVDPVEAQTNASLWEAFARTTADRYGINPADVLTRYGVGISRGEPLEGGLAQRAGQDAMGADNAGREAQGETGRSLDFTDPADGAGQDLRPTISGGRAQPGWAQATRIRGGDGEPATLYRGAAVPLAPEHLQAGQLGQASGNPSAGLGGWFSIDRTEAAGYGDVESFQLDIRNPKVFKVEDLPGFESVAQATAFREQLRAQGFDGIVVSARHLGGRTHVVAFDAEQIIPARAAEGTPDTLFQGETTPAISKQPFYSELARQVDNANMKAAPAQGWKDWIKGLGSKGVKAEEVKWSGLEEWLDLQPGRIPKEAVQEFLANNGVRVEEVMLGLNEGESRAVLDRQIDEMSDKLQAYLQGEGLPQYSADDLLASNLLSREQRDYMTDYADEWERLMARTRAEDPTKFGDYQLPGGENYRELLLTLPESGGKTTVDRNTLLPEGYHIEEMGDGRWTMVRPDGVGTVLSHINPNTPRWAATEEAIRILRMQGVMAPPGWDVAGGNAAGQFTSSHFDEPNILAHVRFNDRTDADGKKVLFIEEFQSDWAQQGRKRGFSKPEAKTLEEAGLRLEHRPDGERFPWAVFDDQGRLIYEGLHEAQVTQRALQEINTGFAASVPAAPFVGKTDAWVALTLKRMIRYAAENGYERIAWTRGEQQVSRYTNALRKAVDAIEWEKTPEGVHIVGYKGTRVQAKIAPEVSRAARDAMERNDNLGFDSTNEALQAVWTHADWETRWEVEAPADRAILAGYVMATRNAMNTTARTKVVDTTEKEDMLSDALGKAMADKIRNDPNQKGTIEGENIRVDDTGMASFYDRIVPNIARDVMKKLGGGKVGETTIQSRPRTMTYMENLDEPPQRLTVPAFDITPAMREKALAGQPLFQGGRGQIMFSDNQTLIRLFENADRSTFLHETGHFFLRVTQDLATAQNAPIAAVRDWTTIAKWLDLSDNNIPRAAHEKFARGFEAYLREGRAPSEELRSAFQRFRDWLIEIYQTIADLKVELTDDIRGVFDRMLTSQSQDPSPGATRSAPPESALGDGLPPPSGEGDKAPAAAGFVPMTVQDDAMKNLLRTMADQEAGWAQEGGKHLGGPPGTPNFSTWIPKSDWWAGRPDKLNAAKTKEAVRKAIAGEPLKKAEQRMVDYLVEVANERMQSTRQVLDNIEAMVAEPGPARDAASQDATTETPDALSLEAERFVLEHPGQMVTIGTNADGTPAQVSAEAYLQDAREAAMQARDDAKLFEVAATCLMGRS